MGKHLVTEVTKKRLTSFVLLFRKFKNCNSFILEEYGTPIFHEAERISFQRKTNTTSVLLQIQKSLRKSLVLIYLSISCLHCGCNFQKMHLTTVYKELTIE